jgi:hypothetical protein
MKTRLYGGINLAWLEIRPRLEECAILRLHMMIPVVRFLIKADNAINALKL